MSIRGQYIRLGTHLALLHRLAAVRCAIAQHVIGVPIAVLSLATCLSKWFTLTGLFGLGLINVMIACYMMKYGWYSLSGLSLKHEEASRIFTTLVDMIDADTDQRARAETDEECSGWKPINMPATFDRAIAKCPKIPSDILWLAGDSRYNL